MANHSQPRPAWKDIRSLSQFAEDRLSSYLLITPVIGVTIVTPFFAAIFCGRNAFRLTPDQLGRGSNG
jgi:hypothetical protein